MKRNPNVRLVTPSIIMERYYDRPSRTWYGVYRDAETGDQIGEAWEDYDKDRIFSRPPPLIDLLEGRPYWMKG